MIKIFLFSLFLASSSIFAEYTVIPDVNFENKLISLGIDSGAPDGKVLTSNINTLTILDVSNSSIIDLTGIQDFIALKELNCYSNSLTTIDISKNTELRLLSLTSNLLTVLDVSKNTNLLFLECDSNSLTIIDVTKNTTLVFLYCQKNLLTAVDVTKNEFLEVLNCSENQISALNVTKNIGLEELICNNNKLSVLDLTKNLDLEVLLCGQNKLTTLDINKNTKLWYLECNSNSIPTLDTSKNVVLEDLFCDKNKLSALDLSLNTGLISLKCNDNSLTKLNLKNNNNLNLDTDYINFLGNPNLSCIQVDDQSYSDANWSNFKDATASYSENCANLSNGAVVFANVSIFPNPTKGQLNIQNIALDKVMVYSSIGVVVKSQQFDGVATNNILDMSGLSKGIYMVAIKSKETISITKIVVE